MSESVKAAEAALMPHTSAIVISVGREHKGNDLGLALEAFGKQRPHRPVDHTAGKNFALTGTALRA